MACDTFLTMLALPVLYLLFGKGPEPDVDTGDGVRNGLAPGEVSSDTSFCEVA
jgi:cobalt-zinc-cadmium resistance protein CzcA